MVWGLFDAEVRYDAKGKPGESRIIALEMAIRWRVRDGKIIEHQAFFDTADMLRQQQAN